MLGSLRSSTRAQDGAAARHVLITWPDYDLADSELGGALTASGLSPRIAPKLGTRSAPELSKLVADAVGAIVSTDPFDVGVLSAAHALRVIARVGVGVDSIDLDAATSNGVVVTVTPGANEPTVADHAVAMMLGVLRRLVEHDAGVRAGAWNRTGAHTPSTLSGATVGLVGYGRTGRFVAQRLRGFDVRLLANDPAASHDDVAELVPLDVLLATSDVVSLHLPLLSATRCLIGARELSLMRPEAILVNTSRGGIVDEIALIDALERRRIAGAALDVFEHEPPRASRLLELPNVLLSPHIAGLSGRSVHEMTCRATASVLDVLAGRVPKHVANPDVLVQLGLAADAAPAGGNDA